MGRCLGCISVVILLCVVDPGASAEDGTLLNSTVVRNLLITSYQEFLQVQSKQWNSSLPSSIHVFPFRRQPEPETLKLSKAAELFQATLQVLKSKVIQMQKGDVKTTALLQWDDLVRLAEWCGCSPAARPLTCDHSGPGKYRSISGTCNNRENPLWGAANIPLVRWLPAEYEDGEREPKSWNRGRLHNGVPLPPVSRVSKEILRSSSPLMADVYSQMLVEWGQFIDHDISFTPQSSSAAFPAAADCLTTCENIHPCFPIETDGACGCLPFFRSTAACFHSLYPDVGEALQRQQMNTITSFMDASMVYGHTPGLQSSLRDLAGLNGRLVVNSKFKDPKGRPYLPSVAKHSGCKQSPEGDRVECFHAGDSRVSEGLPLAALHTLFLREHNRIAEALKHMNDHWSPETIYQETRKIIGAMIQIITMRDYVPKIIGTAPFEDHIGPYGGYDPSLNPSVANVFATAAFRFGHGTIPHRIRRLNESFEEHELFPSLELHDTLFTPWRFIKEGGIDPVLRGVTGTPAPAHSTDTLISDEVTDRLVVLSVAQHMDLAALNLQRGRDHALPGYNAWREFCGLQRIRTLSDFQKVIGNAALAEKIFAMYEHLDNVDVWLGGLVEKFLPGARTGPLFACLIGRQMKAVRDGDRFWWEAEGVFSQPQREALSNASLSRIICDNTDVDQLLPDSFTFRKHPCGFTSCDHLPSVNLEAWKEEESQDLKRCGKPAMIENGDYILASASGKLVAHYSCYHGFQLTGAAAIACEGADWCPRPPQCERAPSTPECEAPAGSHHIGGYS